jgi:hypothetical protein
MFFYIIINLIAKMEVADNVIPSSNSEMAKPILFLGLYSLKLIIHRNQTNADQRARMSIILVLFQLGRLEMLFIKPPFEIAIVGPNFENARKLSIKIPSQCHFLGGKRKGP